MKTIRIFLILLSVCIVSIKKPAQSQNQVIDFTSKWDTVRVLKNPYKGWYHHMLDNGIKRYAITDDLLFATFPGMDHLYLRLAWSYLEPGEGEFDWTYIDRVVEKYVPKGYKISFRITCSETGPYPDAVGELSDGVNYATPGWVRKAGAEGTVVDNGKIKLWVPKWDDPVYLEKLDQFHKAFAARYDGQPWVSYVDIGSIGDWGEGHTSFSTKDTPTKQEVKANMDIYLKNYRKSQLVANDDMIFEGRDEKDIQELYQYAVRNEITFRDDSPLVDWYFHNYFGSSTITNPDFYDPLYLKKPIIMEMEHYHLVKHNGNWLGKNGEAILPEFNISGADVLRSALKIMHATYIGYHGNPESWLADNPDLTKELANRCGYWYFPVKAIVPAKMKKGENSVSIEWLNKGVAPAYTTFGLLLRFEAEKPENSFDQLIENSGNTTWLPGKTRIEKYVFKIPREAARGRYKLSFKLIDQTNEAKQDIQMGVCDKLIDVQGFVYIGIISV